MHAEATQRAVPRHPFKLHAERGDSAPLHPGEILREDFLPYHRLTASELARRLQMPQDTIDALLGERAPLTPELAERLSAVFALPARYWHALQMQFDLWHGLTGPQAV
jgi:antitoxin HigA-1